MNKQTAVHSADEVLCAALDVGEHLLKNGAEIHRVEDTVMRICNAFGAEHAEVFTITSAIFATVRMPNGEHCEQLRRVFKTANNLFLVEEMNRISRELCEGVLPLCNLRAAIKEAKTKRAYPEWVYFFGAMCASSGFAMFFGGTLADALCTALVALPITFVDRHAPRFLNQMVLTALNSTLAGLFSMLLNHFGWTYNVDKVMIGVIMLLIPGLALTTAVRDMMVGDILAGALRLVQSILLALMIAFGFALAVFLVGGAV